MTTFRLKAFAVIAATTLASGVAFAQTSVSPSAPLGSSSSGPTGSSTNEPINPSNPSVTPGGTQTPPAVGAPSSPSTSTDSTSSMGRGPSDALTTPEDRAKCAALSGTAQADCVADARKQRESDDRLRTSRDTSQPQQRPIR